TQGYVAALTASRDQLRGQLALLGETLSSTLDLDRMLEMIVDTATAATGAAAGVVLLVDGEESSVLTAHAQKGLSDRGVDVKRLRVRTGEGLLGQVAARGVPLHGRLDADSGLCQVVGEPFADTFIAVPIMAIPEPG